MFSSFIEIEVLNSYDCFKKFQNPITSPALLLIFKSNVDSIWVFSDGYGRVLTSYSRFEVVFDKL